MTGDYCYSRRHSRPEWKKLVAKTSCMPSTTIMILEWMTASQVLWLIILSGKNQCLRILLRIGITQSPEEVPKTRVVGRHFLWVRYNSLCWIADITVTEKKIHARDLSKEMA